MRVTPDDEGDDGSEEPSDGKVMYMGVDLSEGRGSVWESLAPSSERGDGIGDDGGMGDNGSTVDEEKLDRSMSILECRIK